MRFEELVKRAMGAAVFVLSLACGPLSLFALQGDTGSGARILRALEHREPGCKGIVGIESGRVPMVRSAKTILVATWYCDDSGGLSEGVTLSVYRVENPAEATTWLKPIRNSVVAEGWKVDKYDMGDEGYNAKYQFGKRFAIYFRKANVVGSFSGNDLPRVKRIAEIVVSQVPTM